MAINYVVVFFFFLVLIKKNYELKRLQNSFEEHYFNINIPYITLKLFTARQRQP